MTENQTKEMFSLLTKSVNGIQRLETRFDKLEIKVDKLETRFDKLETKVDKIETKVDKIEKDVAILKSDVAILKSDVSDLKAGQIRIENEVRLNTTAINQVVGEQLRLKIRMDQLEKV